jgi:phosphatidylethanolamine-binding protein (PEBP) family uncharacterized protein
MEQGKGADGLIAALAKATSARGTMLLALAVAAMLAVSGCGGDSDSEPEPETASSSLEAQARTTASSEGAGPGSPAPGAGDQGSSPSGAQGSSGAKQGSSTVVAPSGPREREITPEERAQAQVASIALESPAIPPGPGGPGTLPAAHACGGDDSWPALRWQGIPAGTAELVLFAMGLEPTQGGALSFNWAVAGIDPELEGLKAGELPGGAVIGQNSFGRNAYTLCPPQGASETYVFALYALPERLSARAGFDPAALRAQVQELSRNVGILVASYSRPG